MHSQLSNWFPIRAREIRRRLKSLRLDQATGPDGISAFFLRTLAEYLDVPLAIIIRRIFTEAIWPRKWQVHHISPLFKKGKVYQPGQYRGIHLTCILSKVTERVIGNPLVAFLEKHGYGDSQWFFRKKSITRPRKIDSRTMCVSVRVESCVAGQLTR